MPIRPLFAGALGALLVAACTGVRLLSDIAPSTYDFRNFALYHAGRDTLVEVQGNPFHMDRAAFEKAVTDRMQGANFGRPTNFTTAPGPSVERNLRVVMAFNSTVDVRDLCASGFRPLPGGSGLTLKAAWCFEDREDSWVEATSDAVTSVNDPGFRDLIGETVLNLFPPYMDEETIRDSGDDLWEMHPD